MLTYSYFLTMNVSKVYSCHKYMQHKEATIWTVKFFIARGSIEPGLYGLQSKLGQCVTPQIKKFKHRLPWRPNHSPVFWKWQAELCGHVEQHACCTLAGIYISGCTHRLAFGEWNASDLARCTGSLGRYHSTPTSHHRGHTRRTEEGHRSSGNNKNKLSLKSDDTWR